MVYKNAKSTTINTVITPYNINNENFYPFELFGEACFYKFATPSIAFTPSNLKLNSSEYEKFQRLLCFYLEKYSYHMKSSINIINKRFIKENINEVAKDIIIPEYNLHKRTYYLFDKAYASYNELMKGKYTIEERIKNMLLECLESKECPVLIDPYSYVEYLIYRKRKQL